MTNIFGASFFRKTGYSGYQIDQSMLLDGSTDYLSWTPGSAGDRKTWTLSLWIKRHELGRLQRIFQGGTSALTDTIYIGFEADDKLRVLNGSAAFDLKTNRVFRDVGSWYHIVVVLDTTESTSSNRASLYVNGIKETSFATSSYPTLNKEFHLNNTYSHQIGAILTGPTNYNNASYAEIYFIDGTAHDPTDFGEFYNGTTAWRPIQPSVTYGTNGFYLPFTQDTPNLGTDYSGNGNDWTENGSPVQSSDSPTKNYPTFNSIDNTGQSWTITNGGRTIKNDNFGSYGYTQKATQAVRSGKYYWEATYDAAGSGNDGGIGIIPSTWVTGNTSSNHYPLVVMFLSGSASGDIYTSSSISSTALSQNLSALSVNDVIGVELDMDVREIQFYVNGTAHGTAESISSDYEFIMPAMRSYYYAQATWLFAEDDWTYTPSAGFVELSAANLPDPTITDPGEYFNVVGYTASNSTQSITGVGFQPDLTWHKNRTDVNRHALFDVLRGATNRLASDNTDAEVADADTLTSFDSDGFSIGADTDQFGVNDNGSQEFVTWCWKAGGAGVPNTDGTTTAAVSANDDAGFSIATWASPLSATTIGHGLSAAPELIIAREYDGVMSWRVYHKDVGNGHYLLLDTAGAKSATSDWNSTDPTSSVFSVSSRFNTAGNYLAYCFRSIPGYSKAFSYEGNGSADGPFVYLGFKPKFLLIKSADAAYSWWMYDSEREQFNVVQKHVYANASNAEVDSSTFAVDFLSNGLKIRTSTVYINNSHTYVGIAFAENPFGGSNLPLGLAR